MTVDLLRQQGLVEAVEADPAGALVILDARESHLRSAARISDDDPSGAFQLAYDSARKAINAHMLAHGLRARPAARVGAHVVVGRYGAAVLGAEGGDAVNEFDRMRRRRNRTEYGVAQIEAAEVDAAVGHATAIVSAVRAALT